MPVIDISTHTVELEPLSADAFRAFGDVTARPTGLRRRYLPTSLDSADDARTFSLWISHAETLKSLPLQAVTFERHPFSAQTFVPLEPGRYLVAVCDGGADGRPDAKTVRAFIAGAHQSVTYARNVWHHPMTVLDHPMDFAVAMGLTGRDDDDVFVDLDASVTIVMPQPA